ncbi:hypothetical protein QBC43DRAFT_243388 [Cladorrhinum sp. PSN259]|nr:hypothetical protein QBC43DRAFT_243388 [Cladorrhinum sp. PSN259]
MVVNTFHDEGTIIGNVGTVEVVTNDRMTAPSAGEFSSICGQVMAIIENINRSDPDRVIVDMIKENRITLQRPSDALRDNVIKVLSAESKESAAAYLNTLPSDQATAIIEELKMLQRADATASSREAVPFLSQHQLTSLAVANMPQASFVAASAGQLAAPVAAETHNNAASIVVRNNAAAMRVFEFVRGTGIAALDGTASDRGARLELINRSMENRGVNLNLEALFGNMDQAVLDEATSVYSPAAYLVDLLEYLRSNNLDSKDLKADVTTSGQAPDLRGTALEHLLRRRPDLGDLELSPENTNTKLPYVDIANEVMESFITHLETYSNSSHEPRQAVIEVRNVRSETSAELLSQPQFIKREAYRKLSMANYPMTLPYNQPLDAQRVFLNFLKIKRADLIDYFRPKPPKAIRTAFQKDQVTEAPKNLRALQDTAISYAVDSETLGLAQEEYHILTKNTFWPREFLQMFQDKPLTEDEYHRAIGLPETHDLWGYDTDEQLQATDPSTKTGLQFTKTQLLPRSGLLYADLIDILQTGSINPAIPTGKSSTIFTRIRQSYRFLKSLVDATQTTCDKRFGLLVEFLQRTTAGLFTADQGIDDAVIRSWAVSQFEPAGNIIVLDNAAGGFRLSLSGFLLAINTAPGPDARDMSDMTKPNRDLATHGRVVDGDGVEYKSGVIGSLLPDGSIRDRNGAQMGQVLFDGVVCCGRSPRWVNIDEQFPKLIFLVIPETLVRDPVGVVKGHRLYHAMTADCPQDEVQWQSVAGQTGSASLGNMRLVHLDGTVLTVDEWDKLYCFIRIWRKTGWSVSDIDRALIGLTPRIDSALVGDWTSPMVDSSPVGDWPSTRVEANIDCDLIAELAAVKKLLSLSKLSVEELITFWAPISSRGPSSLYRRLFFSRRVGELDAVFQPDSNGDFFTRLPATISAHRLAISAAFSIRSLQDIDFLITENSVPDQLNLDTLSAIYRRALLSKVLQVGIRDLGQVILCFGNPFKSARECLRVLQRWNRIVGSGFTWAELRYTCDAAAQNSLADDILTPTTAETLDISRDISIGILDIQKRYPLVAKPEDATLELIKETASVLFDKEVVAGIVSLLDGTRTYTVSVPKVENPHFADSVATLLPERRKAQYVLPRKWAPTNAPPATSNSLSSPKANSPATANDKTKWEMAVSRACSQATAFFFDHLSGFLPPELRDILTAPDKQEEDIHYPVSDGTDSKTAQEKAYEFLRHFIPKLQEKLTHEFLVKTITARAGFDDEKVVQLLLDTNMQAASGTTTNQSPAAFILDNLGIDPDRWRGYFFPQVSGNVKFVVLLDSVEQPNPLINQQSYDFFQAQEDPEVIWATMNRVPFKVGEVNTIEMRGILPSELWWKPDRGSREPLPDRAYFAAFAHDRLHALVDRLKKLAVVLKHVKLSEREVKYISGHASDFGGMEFDRLRDLGQLERLYDLVELRDSVAATSARSDFGVLDLFQWMNGREKATAAVITSQICRATGWRVDQVSQVLEEANFCEGIVSEFRDADVLLKMQKVIKTSNELGADISHLFRWASPLRIGDFDGYADIAENIQETARAKFGWASWTDAVRPLNNTLRENQRKALVDYLLVQEPFASANNIVDADGLFEFFLIDVQMTPLVETSRIKQAISSVQLFVQRVLLGLEKDAGVPAEALDACRWEWMSKYRVWEANRKVFLYPENWIEPSLRDDKTEFFRQLESQLLQKDLAPETIKAAMQQYLHAVDTVSNLQCIGLYVEAGPPKKIHVFARTSSAPFRYFYNCFQFADDTAGEWRGWETMQVDIPSYEVGNTGIVGNYIAPIVYEGRLLVFMAQLVKTPHALPTTDSAATFKSMGDLPIASQQPTAGWEIRLGWTEYRAGQWTPRQLCSKTEAAVSPDRSAPIDAFTLIPTAGPLGTGDSSSGGLRIYMEYYFSAAAFGLVAGNWFFNGSQLSHEAHTGEVTQLTEAPSPASFGVTMLPDGSENRVISYQARLDAGPQLGTWAILKQHDMADAFAVDDTGRTSHVANRILGLPGPMLSRGPAVKEPFFFDRAADLLQAANRTTDPQKIFDTLSSFDVSSLAWSVFGGLDGSAAYGRPRFDERGTLSSIYTWELGLHAPMALIDHLFKSQQYEQALRACHYVFDPLRGGDSDDVHRFWVFPPFRYMGPDTIEDPLISRWRDTPLQPHLVARDRPQAYMKWIVMKYIEILIEYGDSLFRQNTLESIPSAIQLYVLASHLYGPRGQVVPQRRSTKRWTYNMLVTGFDAFSNVIVQFEEALPFSTQTPPSSADAVAVMPFVNVFGSVGSLMFAIPDNPQLRALADKIDDRLFKIRHSQDINGGLRQLPLFEPPIYPGLLVQAAAQGLSLGSVMVGLNGPMYNHRFPYLLQKALDMANEVRYLGQALLGAREKADAEALSVLRAQQDLAIQNSLMEIKKLALDDAAKSIDTLQQSRRGIASRLRYYLALISSDATSGVPEIDQDFVELEAKIEKPVAEGGLALSRYESEEFDALEAARGLGTAMAAIETTSAILYALPSPTLSAQPLGVGIQVNAGPSCLAAATSAAARVLSFLQDQRNFEASMASRKGQHQRALQERVLQANAAGYEITGIDKQITAAKIRMAIAQKEIAAQQQTMTQNNELFDFLRQKYSNKDLYAYLDGATRVLFHSAYTQALTLALQAQQVYTFERPSAASQKPIVDASYWGDPSRDGLMSGERLSLALRQLEQAYTSTRGHDYEVIKPTSLRRLDPLALITLRETGTCDFSIPEILYDMDFPGHYMRRIKSVTLVIPCLVGPYASVNATLKLRASRLRVNPSLAGGYVESLSSDQEIDPRFITAAVPISAIAVSSGAGDAGVFELNFHDEGYMPMEGAGAISEWTLSLPSVEEVRPFEYETIGDVVLQVRYTSVEGGEALKKAAADAVRSYVRASDFVGMSGGLVAVFDVRNEFGTAWVRAGADGRAAAVAMPDLNERLPANTRRRRPEEIVATEVWVLTDAELPGGRITLATGEGQSFTGASTPGGVKGMQLYQCNQVNQALGSWRLEFGEGKLTFKKCWMLVRYYLK